MIRMPIVCSLTILVMSFQVASGQAKQPTGGLKAEEQKLGAMPKRILDAAISKDGCHLAFVVGRDTKSLVVVDGQEEPEYDEVRKGSLLFSPDATRVAYVAKRNTKCFVVVDGKKGPEYDGIGIGSVLFSPDGKRMAYGAFTTTLWS